MTIADIMAQVAAGKLSVAEGTRMANESTKSGGGLVVKRNSSGGVYIRHPKFVAHSSKKDKDYIAGINLDPAVAAVLFGDKAVYDEIAAQVTALA